MKWISNILMVLGAFCLITLTGSLDTMAQEGRNSVYPDQLKESDIQKTAQDSPERTAARPFRKIIIEQPGELAFEAMAKLKTMRHSIRQAYPEISDAMLEEAQGSLGVALSHQDRNEEAIDVLIREAWLLSMPAQIFLGILYEHPVEGFKRFDPRILEFFEVSAEDGIPRSQLFMGKILLNGWGTDPDPKKAIGLLKASQLGEAYMVLARYTWSQNNLQAMEEYCKQAAEFDIPAAYYELGVFAQERQENRTALSFFKKTLKLAPTHGPAKLELGRMLLENRGIKNAEQEGFSILKELADGDEGRLSALAQYNVGVSYLHGQGVESCTEEAKIYLKKAANGGIKLSGKILLNLGD